jgi:pyruvate,water dikinase
MEERWIADTVPSEKYPIYTRANAGEVMPDPVTPMSSTLAIPTAGEQGWRDAYVKAGSFFYDEFDPDRPDTVGVFGGYLYLNMSMTRLYGLRTPGLSPEMVDFQYFGDMPGITPYAEEARPDDENELATQLLQKYLDELFTRDDLPELRADRDQVDRLIARRPDLAEQTEQELVDYARSFLPLYRRLFCRHILTSGASGIGIGTVAGVLAAIDQPELIMTLVAGLGDVDSAAPSWSMWDMSRIVKGSPDLTATFDEGSSGLAARLEALAEAGNPSAEDFGKLFGSFIERFGARGPNEWELRSKTWGIDLDAPLAAIDRMRFAPDDESPQARTDLRVIEREAATDFVRELIADDPEAAGTFEVGLRCAHLYNAGRERTKTNNVKIVHEMRLALRELGRRAVDRGDLRSIEQIFMLVDNELDDFVERRVDFRELVAERERYYLSLYDVEPPFVTHGPPPPVSQWRHRAAASGADHAVAGDVLTGIPGCPGVARGRARVVLDPTDPRGLEPGDVLVAPLTDPSWTPLFVPACAVVVDVGAQITHAVIVSRELGLPCVVSVTDATRKIADGAMIEVDGKAGTVTIL